MLTITVAQNGSGDFATIGEAVLAVPYDTPAEILIGPGTYREKLACEKRDITLRGAGMAETRLVWNDGGKLPHPDGAAHPHLPQLDRLFQRRTADGGGHDHRERRRPRRARGPGHRRLCGQRAGGVPAGASAGQPGQRCSAPPLPEQEREKDGFLGPRVFAPRRPSVQYYQGCEITGDIDFIFGGADALFEQCVLRSADNPTAHGEARAM